jgi:hypothetical protein
MLPGCFMIVMHLPASSFGGAGLVIGLAGHRPQSHAPRMFVVSEADAAAIRAVFHQRGELSAVIELRRRFPGLNAEMARECTRTIAGWEPGSRRAAAPQAKRVKVRGLHPWARRSI